MVSFLESSERLAPPSTLRFSLEPSQEFLITVELRHVPDNANRSKGTEGAAHLKNRDTPPPNFRGCVVYVVDNVSTMST